MTTTPVTWVLESAVFPRSHGALREAIAAAGQAAVSWDDGWWSEGAPHLDTGAVVFHGSLGNASRIRELGWRPGAFCSPDAHACSSWYPRAARWLLHRRWQVLPASSLVADPQAAAAAIGANSRLFVRPDSPLKPFAGRVVDVAGLTLAALDHGFYYDDETLPVVVAPVRTVGREWRYVVVDQEVIAGSAYAADGRAAQPDDPGGAPWRLATEIAAQLEPPDEVYVLDLCESDGDLWLLELNPFSGADLYACSGASIVAAVSAAAVRCAVRGDAR